MIKVSKFIVLFLIFVDIILLGYILIGNSNISVLNPQGLIALKERNLIIIATLLSLAAIVPVFILTFLFAWKYRENNSKAKYNPDWNHDTKLELTWWAAPFVIILILAAITWKSTHELDPSKSINSGTKPVTIQVVALQWKWLFIYPEQNIATVNFIQFPDRTPINFELTADAPMNSFWIPQLGGQMYAMAGMGTHLHLMADAPGEFAGSAAEISGRGFSGMKFVARTSSQADFDAWVQSVKESQNKLDLPEYNKLAAPSENNPVVFYASAEEGLYNKIIMKFIAPASPDASQGGPSGGNMHMQGTEH